MKMTTKLLSSILALLIALSTPVFATKLYAPDGRTINVHESEVGAYVNVGWYEYPVVTMYAPDGRSVVVSESRVHEWEMTGWINGNKKTVIYAGDGRMATIPLWQKSTYLGLGWYGDPVYEYYHNTSVPNYGYVTKEPIEAFNIIYDSHFYSYTSTVDNVNKYMIYLAENGWKLFEKNKEGNMEDRAFVKNGVLILLTYYHDRTERNFLINF